MQDGLIFGRNFKFVKSIPHHRKTELIFRPGFSCFYRKSCKKKKILV